MSIIRGALCIGALVTMGSIQARAQDHALGDWHGVLVTPTGRLTVLVRIRAGAAGGYSGDLESVDQGAGEKIPLAKLIASAGKLAFSIPSISATFDGEWHEA